MSSSKDRITDAGFGAAWSLVKKLPEPVADRIFRQAADAAFRRRGPSVVQLAKNLHRVLGEQSTPEALSAVVQAGLRSYARYWKETFRLQGMDHDEVLEQVESTVIGKEHIQRAIDEGRGIVMPITHSGNWDVAGLWVARNWGSMTTVAERLKPESLYEKFVAYRESLGMEILPLTPLPGGRSTSAVLRERLAAGAIVPLVADRDLSASGVPVTFFGEATKVPAGPAMLAALTDSYLCPTNLSYSNDANGAGGWAIHIHPPMSLPGTRLSQQVHGGAQQIARVFEQGISEHPADWHMLQPLWL
ncbi:MAG: phosphatidylinositol mannoside acyltransferase, partial [Nakamurella sp.]